MTTDLLGFLDESKKPVRDPRTGRVSTSGEFYVVAAAVVLSGDIEAIRAELREAVARLGFPFHYADLRSKSRRVDALDAVLSIEGWGAYVFETARPMSPRNNSEHQMRAKALSAAFTVLSAEEGVSSSCSRLEATRSSNSTSSIRRTIKSCSGSRGRRRYRPGCSFDMPTRVSRSFNCLISSRVHVPTTCARSTERCTPDCPTACAGSLLCWGKTAHNAQRPRDYEP